MRELIAVDTETALIGKGLKIPPIVCVTAAAPDVEEPMLFHVREDARDFAVSLLRGDRLITGHGIAFDMAAICGQWPDLIPAVFEAYAADRVTCTERRDKLQHIALGVYRGFEVEDGGAIKIHYSLEDVADRRLNVQLSKGEDSWRLRYGELINVPSGEWPEAARRYALDDAVAALLVHLDQDSEGAELLQDQFRQARAGFWTHLAGAYGIRTSPERVAAFVEKKKAERDRLQAELQAIGLVRKDGSRDTEKASAHMISVCERAGLQVLRSDPSEYEEATRKRHPDGQVKLDADTCKVVHKATGDETLKIYAAFSSLKKTFSTDIPILMSGLHTPIQPRFDILENGREAATSPNTQNWPRRGGMRECVTPRPGFLFALGDYSQFELRTVSQVCLVILGYSALAEALNAGVDPHLKLAARILGIDYQEAGARYKAGDEAVDDARQSAKVANFGFPGGLGPKRFVDHARRQYDVILTEREAIKLKDQWISEWPEFVDYFAWVGTQCEAESARLEQLYVKRWRGNMGFTDACNTLFSGLAADIAKAAGFLVSRACYVGSFDGDSWIRSPSGELVALDDAKTEECAYAWEDGWRSALYGSRIVNFVHDELDTEAPEAWAAEAAEEQARLMRAASFPYLPDVPAIVEPIVARAWSKKAKPVRDQNGRLAPWTPPDW